MDDSDKGVTNNATEDTTMSGIEITTDDLGASVKEEAAEIDLDSLKDAAMRALLAIRKQKEPIYQLQVVRDAINDAIKTDRMGREPEFATYLSDTLGMKIMPQMARERSLDNEVSASLINDRPALFSLYLQSSLFFLFCPKKWTCITG